MNTVKDALAQKSGALIHVRSGDMVVEALRQMRDNRVRSVLVIDNDILVGIVTQGDCAIKVLLPGLDAKQTPVGQVMTGDPVTVKPDDQLEGCMAMMAARGFRHLPVLDAGKIVGVISIGDVVKDIIRNLEHNVGDLMGYIMTDGLGGRQMNRGAVAGVDVRSGSIAKGAGHQRVRPCPFALKADTAMDLCRLMLPRRFRNPDGLAK
jgi:CBS domain-containing protein